MCGRQKRWDNEQRSGAAELVQSLAEVKQGIPRAEPNLAATEGGVGRKMGKPVVLWILLERKA